MTTTFRATNKSNDAANLRWRARIHKEAVAKYYNDGDDDDTIPLQGRTVDESLKSGKTKAITTKDGKSALIRTILRIRPKTSVAVAAYSQIFFSFTCLFVTTSLWMTVSVTCSILIAVTVLYQQYTFQQLRREGNQHRRRDEEEAGGLLAISGQRRRQQDFSSEKALSRFFYNQINQLQKQYVQLFRTMSQLSRESQRRDQIQSELYRLMASEKDDNELPTTSATTNGDMKTNDEDNQKLNRLVENVHEYKNVMNQLEQLLRQEICAKIVKSIIDTDNSFYNF